MPIPINVDNDVYREIMGRLDGTSLTRASGVNKKWRTIACDDALWHALVVREKPPSILVRGAMQSPPPWALECPSETAQAPRTSWRQAYRLSAMWERGRPNCAWPGAHIALSTRPAPQSLNRYDASLTARASLAAELERRHGPLLPQQLRHALSSLPDASFNMQKADGHTALRSARGDVTVFRNTGEAFAYTPLALNRRGRLARQLIVIGHAATDELPSAPARQKAAHSLVHCICVSGPRIDSWHADNGNLLWSTALPRVHQRGRRSEVHAKILGQRGRQFLAAWGSGLAACTIDLNTGKILWQYHRDDDFRGLSLLTPEAGPLVGWDRHMHFRSWPMTDAKASELPPSRFYFGVRPVRSDWDFKFKGLGQCVQDVQADPTSPGHLIATLDDASSSVLGCRTLTISGWGTSVFVPQGAVDNRYVLSDI